LWTAYLCLAGSMALVGSYVGWSKALVAVFPVFLLAWLRFAIGAIAMCGWLPRGVAEPALRRRDRGLLFLESFFGNFLFSVCMLFGVAMSSALAAGITMAALPAVVAIFSRVLLRERIRPRVAAGIACAVAGIALLAGSTNPLEVGSDTSWIGQMLLLGAVCCEALYVVLGKRLTARAGPKRISALINLWGLALVTPFGLWQALRFDFGAVPAAAWLALAAYSLAASVATVWLWMTGLRRVDAATAGTFTVFLPISAAAVGVLFYDEPVGFGPAAAFALALAGILLATWSPSKPPLASS
jgi:drug/metabolite transporter (DMT)-like permease